MGMYTQSIREILQMNKTPQQDLTKPSDVYAIASEVLFDNGLAAPISSDYREAFITGFALHFFNEELGYETFPLWKIALAEKVYNNAAYINLMFQNLDKQIYADYRVRQTTNEGSTSDSKNGSGTSSETDNTIKTGSNTSTLTKAGSETRVRGGYDDYVKSGSEVQKNVGNDVVTDQGTQDNVSSNASGTYTNGLQIVADTPMGNVTNIRTPGGDVDDNTSTSVDVGTQRDLDVYGFGGDRGIDYAEGQTYNYMTNASTTDQSVTNVENANDATLTHNESTTVHGHIVGTTYGVDEDGTVDERKDRTNYNSKDSISYGVDSEGVADARTDTTVASTRDEDATTKSSTTSNLETNSGTHEDETNEVEYTLNWEVLYKSIGMLDKVWQLFDDLFMLIF